MTFAELVNGPIVGIVENGIIPLLYAAAFLFFFYGVFQFFFTGGEENRKKGKTFIMWGLIGFFVSFSVWGIVNVFIRTFNLEADSRPRTTPGSTFPTPTKKLGESCTGSYECAEGFCGGINGNTGQGGTCRN